MAKRAASTKTWNVFYAGGYLGQVRAATQAAALRKARYEWGSSGPWSDAQLRKFAVRSNPGRRKKTTRRAPASKTISLRNFTGKVRLNPDKTVSVAGVGKRGAKKRSATKRRATRRRR